MRMRAMLQTKILRNALKSITFSTVLGLGLLCHDFEEGHFMFNNNVKNCTERFNLLRLIFIVFMDFNFKTNMKN